MGPIFPILRLMAIEDIILEFEDEDAPTPQAAPKVAPKPVALAQAPAQAAAKPATQTQSKIIVPPKEPTRSKIHVVPPLPATAPRPAPVAQAAPASAPAPKSTPVSIDEREFDLAIREAMLDFKVSLLSDLMSDVKNLDKQVGQWLSRLATKHPESKQELLQIKKLLADFAAKKRK